MDNLKKDPQGAEDITASSGQSEEGTQASETEKAEAEVKEESTPWADNPKFKGKSAEDIYQAYNELEKQTGSLGQKAEIANLIEEKYGLTADQFKERLEAQEQQAQEQAVEQDPTGYLAQQVQKQQNELALMKEEKSLDNFLQENPDYKPFKDKMMKLALGVEQDKPYEDIAEEYFGEAIKTGKQSAYNQIDKKKKTQSTGVSSAKDKEVPDLENMTSEEMEKVLPHAPTNE